MYRDGVSEGQAVGMLITIETAAIRVGFGVAPVRATPLGHPVQPNTEPIVLICAQLFRTYCIEQLGTDQKLSIPK